MVDHMRERKVPDCLTPEAAPILQLQGPTKG